MGKYNKEAKIPTTKLVYKKISTQPAKENKKFKYSLVKCRSNKRICKSN